MRKGLLSTVATTLVSAGSALAQVPNYLPNAPEPTPGMARVIVGAPVLLPTSPMSTAPPLADPGLTGGSTGLRPGVDCLPDPGDVCKSYPRVYGDIAYTLTWIKNGPQHFPLAALTPIPAAGAGPVPGTIFLGGGDIDSSGFNGVRATAGVWLDRKDTWGIEASGFLNERRSDGFRITSDGAATNPLALVRPVIDASTGQIVTAAVAVPGVTSGTVLADSSSHLWGTDGNFVLNYRDCAPMRIDLLAGFRYIDLRETLDVVQASATVAAPVLGFRTEDLFDTRNQFYGGQVGSRLTYTCGRVELTLTSKFAMGFTHEAVDRTGTTLSNIPTFAPLPSGGLLVQGSNAGRDTQDRFAIAPETTLQIDYRLTEHLSAFIGYNFLYVSSVARPGDQVDPVVDLVVTPIRGLALPGSSPGATRPAGGIQADSFYAQSVMVGMGYKW